MKKINNFDELNKLISMHFKKGVYTNCFVSKEELQEYINKKRLFYTRYESGLLIFIKMQGYYNMKYYINDVNCDFRFSTRRKIVTEIAGKTEKSLETIVEFFKGNQWNIVLNRLRFSCEESKINESLEIEKIEKLKLKDYAKIIKILRKNYDKYTGCIPLKENIKLDIKNGNFYCYKEDNKILGILHICNKANKSEMRHLVVLKECRGKSIAKRLITRYLIDAEEKSKQVWTSTNNEIAKNLFMSFGYEADGYVSYVLTNNM